jgi:hypothetical protein
LSKSAALLQTTYLRKAIEDRFGKGSVPKVRLRPLGCAAPSGGSLRGTLATVDLPPDLVAATSDHEERQMVGDIARQLARQGLLQFFVAVAAHGGQTWLVSSFDEKRVCALLTEATKVDPSAGTTRLGAARAELPLLTKAPALLGGFTSIGAILTGDSDVGSIEAVEALPFGGRTPIPFLVTAESAGPAATLHAEMWFAEGAVRDLPGALSSLREQEE